MKKYFLIIYCFYGICLAQLELRYSLTEDNIVGNSRFGSAISDLGDINNDSFEDFLVYTSTLNSDLKIAELFLGGTTPVQSGIKLNGSISSSQGAISGHGDLNNDGINDIVVIDQLFSERTIKIYWGGENLNKDPDVILSSPFNDGSGYNNFGQSVAFVHDVNGDKICDLVVTSMAIVNHGNDLDRRGIAFLYFGGKNFDENPSMYFFGDDIVKNEDPLHGCCASALGDINDDGYNDFAVGAYNFNEATGKVSIYFGGPDIDTEPDLVLQGERTGNYFGYHLAGGYDVSGDGYPDLVVTAIQYWGYKGRVYVYYGGPEMDDQPDRIFTGELEKDRFGETLSIGGDFDEDSVNDILIGNGRGKIYCFSGADNANTNPFQTLSGGNGYGLAINTSCDINGDGKSDLIVGEPGVLFQGDNTGKIYTYLSSVENFDWESDFEVRGPISGNFFGASFACGDVNNDGFKDLWIGARGFNRIGRSYLYLGGNDFKNEPVIFENPPYPSSPAIFDINNDGFDDLFSYSNSQINFYWGGKSINPVPDKIFLKDFRWQTLPIIVNAKDFNGDGFNDIIIQDKYHHEKRTSFIFWGGNNFGPEPDLVFNWLPRTEDLSGFKGVGDVNGDGYDDLAFTIGENTKAGIMWGGPNFDTKIQTVFPVDIDPSSINSIQAGDINHDGFSDIILSAGKYNGVVYVFKGGPNFDGTPDFIYNEWGKDEGNRGVWVRNFNNDKFCDILVRTSDIKKFKLFFGSNDFKLKSIDLKTDIDFVALAVKDLEEDGIPEFINFNEWEQPNGIVNIYSMTGTQNLVKKVESYVLDFQNYPNPFNSSTTLYISLKQPDHYNIAVYNILGRKVADLVDRNLEKGEHNFTWTGIDNLGRPVSSGIYFAKLYSENEHHTHKMILVR